MTNARFLQEIKRLTETYHKQAYPEERVKLFWNGFGQVDDQDFTECVSNLILRCRQAPMYTDFVEELDLIKQKKRSQQADYLFRDFQNGEEFNLVDMMDDLAQKDAGEFAKKCVALLKKRVNGTLTAEQFEEEINLLTPEVEVLMTKRRADLCPDCSNSGYVTEMNEKTEHSELLRCYCAAGARREPKLKLRDETILIPQAKR